MKKIFLAVILAGGFAAAAAAQTAQETALLAGSPVYSDPVFQDYVETSFGYLNPRNRPLQAPAFRDAVASPAADLRKAPAKEGYVFVRILPKAADYTALVRELARTAGFVFKGERTAYSKGFRQTRILGWVKVSALKAVRGNPGVAGVSTGRRKAAL